MLKKALLMILTLVSSKLTFAGEKKIYFLSSRVGLNLPRPTVDLLESYESKGSVEAYSFQEGTILVPNKDATESAKGLLEALKEKGIVESAEGTERTICTDKTGGQSGG